MQITAYTYNVHGSPSIVMAVVELINVLNYECVCVWLLVPMCGEGYK